MSQEESKNMSPSSPSSQSSSSSSSPIDDPKEERPVSRGSLLPLAAPPKAFKKYGQDYEYAETWQNPLPELIVSNSYTHPAQVGVPPAVGPSAAGAAATAAAIGSGDGGYDTGSTAAHHDNASSHRRSGTVGSKEAAMQESVWVEPVEPPWYKKITRQQWLISGVTFLGILAVLLAILGAMGKLTGSDSDAASSGGAASSSSVTTTAGPTSTSATALPSATSAVKIACNDKSTFFTGINVILIDKAKFDVSNATATAEDCCVACLEADQSCAAWQFEEGNQFTPCLRMFLTDDNPNKDDKCPQGRAVSSTFTHKGQKVAGMGPCSDKAIQA
ncbi:hypothetical protein QBC43DRAFT_105965 [Cladorrhinum sp. PSN259]|nr:hypothetical protein QBC43DRAFT_105965 [Cladorrhinum sp. PSN259]